MKTKVFIGSSSEAVDQARLIEDLLRKVKVRDEEVIEPLIWEKVFEPGEYTLESIRGQGEQADGAVFLATPDDQAQIRERSVRTWRDNVLFEYGYFFGKLSRQRVLLCVYDSIDWPERVPTDLDGLALVRMGPFDKGNPSKSLSGHAKSKISKWAAELNPVPRSLPDDFDYIRSTSNSLALTDRELEQALENLNGWTQVRTPFTGQGSDGLSHQIIRTYAFPVGEGFQLPTIFIAAATRICNVKRHHPHWECLGYRVRVRLTTRSLNHRISQKDIDMAHRLDELYYEYYT